MLDFFQVISQIRTATFRPAVIESGFRKSGLWPINPKIVTNEIGKRGSTTVPSKDDISSSKSSSGADSDDSDDGEFNAEASHAEAGHDDSEDNGETLSTSRNTGRSGYTEIMAILGDRTADEPQESLPLPDLNTSSKTRRHVEQNHNFVDIPHSSSSNDIPLPEVTTPVSRKQVIGELDKVLQKLQDQNASSPTINRVKAIQRGTAIREYRNELLETSLQRLEAAESQRRHNQAHTSNRRLPVQGGSISFAEGREMAKTKEQIEAEKEVEKKQKQDERDRLKREKDLWKNIRKQEKDEERAQIRAARILTQQAEQEEKDEARRLRDLDRHQKKQEKEQEKEEARQRREALRQQKQSEKEEIRRRREEVEKEEEEKKGRKRKSTLSNPQASEAYTPAQKQPRKEEDRTCEKDTEIEEVLRPQITTSKGRTIRRTMKSSL